MEQTMLELQSKHSWKDSLRKSCRVNKLTIDLAAAYTPLRFRGAYARFKAIYQRRPEDKADRWLENQLKAFEWFVVALSLVSSTNIKDFNSQQIDVLKEVFYFKQPVTIQYQVRKLQEDPTEKQLWDKQEEQILTKIVLQCSDGTNKWNQFARKLYETTQQKFFRTGKQCRQRWLNHLDPNKKHGQWTQEEDLTVAQLFLSDGRKWSQISRKMGGARTEHMVKNRFKTLILKQKKIHPNISNQFSLLKTFIKPHQPKNNEANQQEEQKEKEPQVKIKDEYKSEEVQLEKMEEQIDISRLVKEEKQKEENKNVPQTSSGFEPVPQVFSPWVMGYSLTPSFSPFFVNVSIPTFSSFQASFNQQFYAPSRPNDKPDQF